MIKFYTSKGCASCPTVKKYLDMREVEYEQLDREEGSNANDMLAAGGAVTTPMVISRYGIAIGPNMSKVAEIVNRELK